jgi:hypothetical protein
MKAEEAKKYGMIDEILERDKDKSRPIAPEQGDIPIIYEPKCILVRYSN